MHKAGVQQSLESFLQVNVGVGKSFDQDLKDVSYFRALDDRANVLNSLESRSMHLLMSIIQHLSDPLDNLREEPRYLFGGTVSHVSQGIN